MVQFVKLLIIIGIFTTSCIGQAKNTVKINMENSTFSVQKTDKEWKESLSPEQYHVLREKGTERPNTGKYNLFFDKGTYFCAGCGQALFTSDSKFKSSCGWPSFDSEIREGNIKYVKDSSFGMERVEIVCSKCGGHLGHVFDDGPTSTGLRYCVNSLSVEFKQADK